jgi:hypothetical protein
MSEDIIDKLRRLEKNPYSTHPCGLLDMSADEIEHLRAENERLREALRHYACDCEINQCEVNDESDTICGRIARAAAEAIGLKEMMEARLNDDEISRILDGVRRQVEWNGWEEPYVTNRFKSELKAIFSPKQLKNNGDTA